MLHNIIKALLFGQLLLFSIYISKAQEPVKSKVLFGEQSDKQMHIARDYIKFTNNFHYKPTTSTSYFKAKIDRSLVFDADYLEGENPTPTLPFSISNAIGSLPGSVDVSATGAATYTIPVTLPPGTAGVMPGLSIVYNSQSGSGMLGHGWTIGGFSAITRIATNLHDDGEIDGVDFDNKDKFALDGNRLVAVSGAYGASSTEYRTHAETYSRIYSQELIGDAPERFIVETKDGRTLEYGFTEDSRFIVSGKYEVLVWLLNKVTDISGNYYTISYTRENNEYYPKEIKYTGNESYNAQLDTYNTIKFHFDRKSDPSLAFVGDVQVNSSVILRELVIECEGKEVYKYEFNYKADPLSKLTEIVYSSEENKLNSTKINWPTDSYNSFIVRSFNANEVNSSFIAGDYNGDSYTDMVQLVYDESKVYRIKLLKNNSKDNAVAGDFSSIYSKIINSRAELLPGDFNGDGKTDLIVVKKTGSIFTSYNVDIYISNGVSFSELELGIEFILPAGDKPKFRVGDFNGDRQADWVIMKPNETYTSENLKIYTLTNVNASPNSLLISSSDKYSSWIDQVKIADFNGNGKSDIMLINEYTSQILEHDGSTDMKLIKQGGYPTKDHRIFTGDFNGDGKADVLTWLPSVGWEMTYSGEADFIWTSFPEVPELENHDPHDETYYHTVKVADLDGDGKDDIFENVFRAGPNNTVNCEYSAFYSMGASFREEFTSFDATEKHKWHKSYDYSGVIDFNGDGKEDVLLADFDTPSERKIIYFHPNQHNNFVESITNGFDKAISFEYFPYTHDHVYISGSGDDLTNNVREIRPSIMVVKKINKPNYEGGDDHEYTSYRYRGLKFHTKGKGLLGFESIFIYGLSGQVYSRDYGYEPMFFSTFLTKSDSRHRAYETETNYTNKVKLLSAVVGEKRYFPYIEKVEKKDLETGITVTTHNKTYDNFGNVTLQEITHGSDGTTEITNEYTNADRWCPSMIKKSTVKKTRTGKEPITNITEFVYYNGIRTKTIIEPGSAKEVTTISTPNGFGLPYQVTVSAPGEETRLSTIEYDDKYRFVEKTTNPLGFSLEKTFVSKNGNILTEKDVLGNTTRHTYDAFGNLKTSIFPNNTTLSVERKWDRNSDIKSYYYIKETLSGSSPVITHYNHFGKEVQVETKNFNDISVFTNTEYNDLGKIAKKYGPATFSKGGEVTTFEYRYIDKRLESVSNPIGLTSYSYEGKKTTITPPSGQSTSKTINAYGDVILAHDNGGDIIYTYNSAGQPVSIEAPGGATVTMDYDLYGNKKSIIDPNAGTINYTYDAFGNLKTQTDAKNNQFTMTYDKLNRLLTKIGTEGTTTYVYDNAVNGKGKIESVTGPNNISIAYEYDELGREIKLTETLDGRSFAYAYSYDNYGRQKGVTYPSGFQVINHYENGYLKAIRNSDETKAYWEGLNYNKYGQLTQAKYGNGQTVTKGYDTHHRLNLIDYSEYSSFDYEYYPTTGNLKSRTLTKGVDSLAESFTYDNLNRLDIAKINGDIYLDMQYDPNGNITFKNDAGTYQYTHSTKLHAVTGLKDLPENSVIPSADQNITYNGFNKVSLIEEDNYNLQFVYGPDQLRRKTILSDNTGVLKTKYFVGAYEEEITTSGTRKVHYIAGADGLAAVYIEEPGTAPNEGETYYTYTDQLGSIIALADKTGHVAPENEQSFGPWGRRRNTTNWLYDGANTISLLDRGYTGHQHLEQFGIINMNGRLYDPVLGRILSPDKYVGYPDYTQSFNRFSYGLNNPLSYVDPDGNNPLLIGFIVGAFINTVAQDMQGNINSFGDFFKAASIGGLSGMVGAWAGGVTPGIGFAEGLTNGIAGGFSGGFVGGVGNAWASGASFGEGLGEGIKSGIIGGFTSGAVSGISGGIYSVKHGGNFWSGADACFDATYSLANSSGDKIIIHKKLKYSSVFAKNFSEKYIIEDLSDLEGLTSLIADGSFPENGEYTKRGDLVFNKKGSATRGTTRYLGNGRSRVYLYKAAFTSPEQLYLTTTHEFMHVSFNATGMIKGDIQHASIYKWQLAQAKAWNFNVIENIIMNDMYKSFYHSAFDYHKFGYGVYPKPWK